jgi:hypothetical protein
VYSNHKTYNISWQFMFWIDAKSVGIVLVSIQFVITYRLRCKQRKLDALSYCLYLAPKEGDVAYEQ